MTEVQGRIRLTLASFKRSLRHFGMFCDHLADKVCLSFSYKYMSLYHYYVTKPDNPHHMGPKSPVGRCRDFLITKRGTLRSLEICNLFTPFSKPLPVGPWCYATGGIPGGNWNLPPDGPRPACPRDLFGHEESGETCAQEPLTEGHRQTTRVSDPDLLGELR